MDAENVFVSKFHEATQLFFGEIGLDPGWKPWWVVGKHVGGRLIHVPICFFLLSVTSLLGNFSFSHLENLEMAHPTSPFWLTFVGRRPTSLIQPGGGPGASSNARTPRPLSAAISVLCTGQVDWRSLAPPQLVNHYENDAALTTKSGGIHGPTGRSGRTTTKRTFRTEPTGRRQPVEAAPPGATLRGCRRTGGEGSHGVP